MAVPTTNGHHVVPPPLSGAAPAWAVRQLERTPNVVGVAILAAVCGLSLWHTRHTLGEALTRVQLANRVLEESERSLEDEVRKRTAELVINSSPARGTARFDVATEA